MIRHFMSLKNLEMARSLNQVHNLFIFLYPHIKPHDSFNFFQSYVPFVSFFSAITAKAYYCICSKLQGHYFFQTTLGPLSTTPATSKFEMCQMYLRSFAVQNQFLRSFIRVTKRVAFKKQIQMSKLQKEYGSDMKLNRFTVKAIIQSF